MMYLKLKFGKILPCLLFFLILIAIPPQTQALTVQQTLAQSQAGDRVYEVSGDVFYAYGGSCTGTGCEITEPPAPSGWKLLGFDDSSWSQAIDAYTQGNAYDWWCVSLPGNCRPIGQTPGTYTPGDPDQTTGPSGFVDRETLLLRKAYTVSPPSGYRTSQVILEVWSDNNSWAYAGGSSGFSLVGTAGLDYVTIIDITAITLTGFGDTQTFAKEVAIQVSNDDQGEGNPVGVQYRVKATYETIPIAVSGIVTDSNGNPIVGVTINQGVTNPLPGPNQECLIGTATTGADGRYTYPSASSISSIPAGQGFCLRPPAVPGYLSPPNPASYECQKAGGYFNPDACGLNVDLTPDNAYNFVYTPISLSPNLGALKINANTTEGAKGTTDGATYGITGLRANDPNLLAGTSGSNFFNSLSITQTTDAVANPSNVKLVGVAFTESGAAAPANNSNLQTLMSSAEQNRGFIMIYAFCAGQASCMAAGQTFTAGTFSVYYGGTNTWKLNLQPVSTDPADFTNILVVKMNSVPDLSTNFPTFIATLYQQLGSRTWGTYGYLLDNNNNEKSVSLNPTP